MVCSKYLEKKDVMQEIFTQIGPKRKPEIAADIFGKHDY
jgi:hypothetical protein